MGAVNYFTSDYITIGLRPYDTSDLENDLEFMGELKKEIDEYGGTLENALQDYMQVCYESDFENIETELNKHNFYYYHITIKPGYYEGFSIDIENNFPVAFDNWEDKKDAQKEITEIKAFLIDCVNMGLCQVFPGWCTSYLSRSDSLQGIKKAIAIMREEVKNIPTWRQYEKQSA